MTESPENDKKIHEIFERLAPHIDRWEQTIATYALEHNQYQRKSVDDYIARKGYAPRKTADQKKQFLTAEIAKDPFTFFVEFYRRDPRVDSFTIGKNVARAIKENSFEKELAGNNFSSFLETPFEEDVVKQLSQRSPPQKRSVQDELSYFFDKKTGRPLDKFSYWVVPNWSILSDQKKFDPAQIGVFSEIRDYCGFGESDLPEIPSQGSAAVQKQGLQDVRDRISGSNVVEIINRLKSCATNQWPDAQPSIALGKIIGNACIETFQQKSEEFTSDLSNSTAEFSNRLETRKRFFRSLVEGNPEESKFLSEERERVNRALNGTSRLQRRNLINRLNRVPSSGLRLIQKALSSPENAGIFKPKPQKENIIRTVGGVGFGVGLSRAGEFIQNIRGDSYERWAQLGLLATGFLTGKLATKPANILKQINWSQITKASIRGGVSLGLALGADALLRQTGIIPTTIGAEFSLPFELTTAKLLASSLLGGLKLNFGTEASMQFLGSKPLFNRIFQNKEAFNELSEYVYFRNRDHTLAKPLYEKEQKRKPKDQKWLAVADLIESNVAHYQSFHYADLLPIVHNLKALENSIMIYLIHNPSRYQKRIVSRNGQSYEIDNQNMLESLFLAERKLHLILQLNKNLKSAGRNHIASILEGTVIEGKKIEEPLSELQARLNRKIKAMNIGSLVGPPFINTAALIIGSYGPVKQLISDSADFILGKVRHLGPHISVRAPAFTPRASDFYHLEPSTSYDAQLNEVGKRLETLYTLSNELNRPSPDPRLIQRYQIRTEEIRQFNDVLKKNNLTIKDLVTILRFSAHSKTPDQFIKVIASAIGSGENGTNHNDLGALVRAISNYSQDNGLNRSLKELVRNQGLTYQLYGYPEAYNSELLDRLGIDTKSLEFQLSTTSLSPEKIRQIIGDQEHPLTVEEDFVIIKDPSSPLIFKAPKNPESLRNLNILQNILSADRAELQKALTPHQEYNYLYFIAEAERYKADTNTSPLFSAIAKQAEKSFSKERVDELLKQAVDGDVKAYNILTNPPNPPQGAAIFIANKDVAREFSNNPRGVFAALLNKAKTKEDIVRKLTSYTEHLGLTEPVTPGVKLPFEPNTSPFGSTSVSLPQLTFAQLLNGETKMDDAMRSLFNQDPILFTDNGKITGWYLRVIQESSRKYSDDLMDMLNNIEGPDIQDSGEFLKTLIGRNGAAWLNDHFDLTIPGGSYSGVSGPAMQLVKLFAGEPGYDPIANYTQLNTQLSFFHQPEKYSPEYLLKLLYAISQNQIPREMEDAFNPQRLASVQTPQYCLNVESSIMNRVIAKLELYLAAQRMLSIYGVDEVHTNYLNYYPAGSALLFQNNQAVAGIPLHGLGAASEYYFGKPVEKLAQGEKLILIGMIQAPNAYSPIRALVLSEINAQAVRYPNGVVRELTPQELEQGFIRQEEVAKERAEAVLNIFAKKKNLSATEIANLKDEIVKTKFIDRTKTPLPEKWLNTSSNYTNKAYQIIAQIQSGNISSDVRSQMNDVADFGGVVDVTPPQKIKPRLPKVSSLEYPDQIDMFARTKQNALNSYIRQLMPPNSVKGIGYNLTVNPKGIPQNISIPVFQQYDAFSNQIVNNPGFAMKFVGPQGEDLAYFDRTNILGRGPKPYGSTLKPFIAAYALWQDHKKFQMSTMFDARPGPFALDGSNQEIKNWTSDIDTDVTLGQALVHSINVPFQKIMKDILGDDPSLKHERWTEFQDFLGQFGLTLTDERGNMLTDPTAYAAIGGDAYVRFENIPQAYVMLANPQDWFSDPKMIKALTEVRETLFDDNLKVQPLPTGYTGTLGILSSENQGQARAFFEKTGTYGYKDTTQYTLTSVVIKMKNGKYMAGTGIVGGQTMKIDPVTKTITRTDTNLEDLRTNYFAVSSILPIMRQAAEQLVK